MDWIDEDAITEDEGRAVAEKLGIDVDAWAQSIKGRANKASRPRAFAPAPFWALVPMAAAGVIAALAFQHHATPAKPTTTIIQDSSKADGGSTLPAMSATSTGPCPASMALIPGGEFTTVETREHARVTAFCLDRTEVTVAAYDTCVRSGDCSAAYLSHQTGTHAPVEDSLCNGASAEYANHPANCIDWNQADTYCSAMGLRLPTDAEWEWAARSGVNAWTYPWGNEPPDNRACWYKRDGTCGVASFPAGDNPWGVHDLSGNVLEWTSGFYNGNANLRVIRGGGWLNAGETMLTAGTRYGYTPTDRRPLVGFRCAADSRR